MFHDYPYTDAHELNLDWIIGKIKHIDDTKKETEDFMEAAQAAQTGAETAQEAAETAQGKAEDAQEAAETAQDKAEDAQEAAETAQGKAEDAQEAAEAAVVAAVEQSEAVVEDTLDQISLLQARVDNIIPSGTQTAGNTELLDIRVGYDGYIYDSAGNAVRGQVSDIHDELNGLISDSFRVIRGDCILNEDEEPGEIFQTSTFRGFATRYGVDTPFRFIDAVVRLKSNSSETSVVVYCDVYDGTFTTLLASANKTITIDASSQQRVNFSFNKNVYYESGDIYICIYVENGFTLMSGGAAYSQDSCSATATYKNKYLTASSTENTWSNVDNVNNYCLYCYAYAPFYLSKKPSNFVLIGDTVECDYNNVQDALDNIDDSEDNPITLFVLDGTYPRFSMVDHSNTVRYVSIIGQSRENTIFHDDTGNYNTPTSEIHTNGCIKNCTFIEKATPETYVSGGTYNYAYAMHDDYDGTNTSYENCTFYSNAGPAIGMGLRSGYMKRFVNCDFISESDGTYGDTVHGACFIHNDLVQGATEQKLSIESCMAYNKYGADGFHLSQISGYTGGYEAHVRNSGSFSQNSGTVAFVTMPLSLSFGNNADALNVI